jgi:hypothetical protein
VWAYLRQNVANSCFISSVITMPMRTIDEDRRFVLCFPRSLVRNVLTHPILFTGGDAINGHVVSLARSTRSFSRTTTIKREMEPI